MSLQCVARLLSGIVFLQYPQDNILVLLGGMVADDFIFLQLTSKTIISMDTFFRIYIHSPNLIAEKFVYDGSIAEL